MKISKQYESFDGATECKDERIAMQNSYRYAN
jgi:hypothetical protein